MNSAFKKMASPYLIWLYILALFPAIIMFGLMFLETEGLSFEGASFTFANFEVLGEEGNISAFLTSFKFAFISTVLAIFIGYLLAYRVFRSKFSNKFLILTILILPMWSNILLRIEALGNIMEPNNIMVDLLSKININLYINIKGTELAVIIGLVFTYLPFMILPIYTALEKIDYSLEEAALDLGVTNLTKFWKVIFPMSAKGIIAGSIMVFLPSLSGFAIPKILGKGNIPSIGDIIEKAFMNMTYNLGSLFAIIVLIVILGSLIIINKVDKEGELLL
jgi:spermidine/putrescine transport system permease protein